MKKALLFIILATIYFTSYSQTNPGDVIRYKKIGNNLGGLGNVLAPNAYFGASVCKIGDINNDGVDDIAAGIHGTSPYGGLYILFMDTNGTVSNKTLLTQNTNGITNLVSGSAFGSSVCSIGDINSDGINDIAVGAILDSDGGSGTGAIYIICLDSSGNAISQTKISKTAGNSISGGIPIQAGGHFGCDLDYLGDLNNDGNPEIAVGNSWDDQSGTNYGAFWILSLDSNNKVSSYYKIRTGVPNFNPVINYNDYFGQAISGIGDFNNDGIPDVAVSAIYDDDAIGNSGAIYIIHLDTNSHVKSYNKISNFSFPTSNPINGTMGASLSVIPDLTGDGHADIMSGAARYPNTSDKGAIYIFFLDSTENITGHKIITYPEVTNPSTSRLGRGICSLGDYNMDGYPEIAANAPYEDYGKGMLYIISLKQNLSVTTSVTSTTCNGGSNGMAIATGNGVNPPFTFLWSNGSTNDTIFGLSAGSYSVTMTNSVGNIATKTISITEPSAISLSTSADASICNGSVIPLVAIPNGGTGSKTVFWDNGLGTGYSKTVQPNSNTIYSIYAQDANNCLSDTAHITINVNSLPTASFSGLNVAYCSNDNSVSLSGSPSGGSFSGAGISGAAFSPANANTGINQIVYSYTDANGCTGRDTNSTNVIAAPDVVFSGINSAYCTNDASFSLSAKASPTGGSFWVNGSSATDFNPQALGAGTFKIKYLVTNSSGCSDADSVTTYVNPAPSASFSGLASSYCENSSAVSLTGTPAGGSFSGSGISGSSFNPANAGLGTKAISYSYTNMYGCTDVATNSTTINALTALTVSSPKSVFCNNDDAVSITVSPLGGTLSGSGVTNANKSFDPSAAGTGSKTILYTFTNPYGCTSTQSIGVTVNAPASLSISGLNVSYCANNIPASLSGSPSGGSFFGNGVSVTSFSPVAAGVGTHNVHYRYDNGCIDTLTQSVTVYALPSVSISGLATQYCLNDNTVALIGNPAGGGFSGSGISGSNFNPSAAGVGSHNISYISAADSHSCLDTAIQAVVVNGIPNISFAALTADQCVDNNSVVLSANPSGGSFAGNAVSGSNFSPSAAGVGSHRVYYAITDANSCSNTDSFSFVVHALPSIAFNLGSSCANISSMSLSASPSGGSFSGSFVSGSSFNPSAAGVGSHQVIYSYTDAYSCSNSDTEFVMVNALPAVSISTSSANVCIDGGDISLSGIPYGGTFSGSGITDSSFAPSSAGVGSHSLVYSFTDANLCVNSDTSIVVVHALPSISFGSLNSESCVNDNAIVLSALPAGGSFSGNFVSSGNFYPANAGVGSHKVFYTFSDSYSCSNTDSFIFNVHALPTISFNVGASCSNISSMSLSASPAGGSFSGNFVSGFSFNPSAAGVGAHQVIYSFTDSYSCSNADTQNILVNAAPIVNFSLTNADLCVNGIPISLSASPAGGVFSGNGISGNTFAPASAGIGNHSLVYSFTDANLCSNSDTSVMVVHSLPNIAFANFDSTSCLNNPFDTIYASPVGGSFIGAGMTANVFSAYAAGVGSHSIKYSFTDSYNCSNTDSISIVVFANPTVSIVSGLNASNCKNDLPYHISYSPAGGIYGGANFVVNDTFYPNLATTGKIGFIYSYVDANGCSAGINDSAFVFDNPIANAGSDTLIPCNSNGAMIGESPDSNFTFLWSPYAGLSSPFVANPVANPWVNTVFVLTKTNIANQCSSLDSVVITLPNLPSVSIAGDTVVCFGDSLHLTASGTDSLAWRYNISGPNFDFLPYITQFINVVGVDSNNCMDRDSVLVLVNPKPLPNLGPDTSIYGSDSLVLFPGSFSSYSWNNGSFNSSIVVFANALNPGNYSYSVEVENQYGCSNSDTIVISITTGVRNLLGDNTVIRVFPNPSSDWINVDFSSDTYVDNIQLFDANGKLLRNDELNSSMSNFSINVQTLAKGRYFLNISMGIQRKTFTIFVE